VTIDEAEEVNGRADDVDEPSSVYVLEPGFAGQSPSMLNTACTHVERDDPGCRLSAAERSTFFAPGRTCSGSVMANLHSISFRSGAGSSLSPI
jgi:hypothetical protein